MNRVSEKLKIGRLLNFKISNKASFIPSYRFHASAKELSEQVPEDLWDNFYKFAFVRNPWDWQVSQYHYMLRNKNHFQNNIVSKLKSFEDFLDWRINEDLVLQKEMLCNEDNKILVDFVGKLETINDDILQISQHLNIYEVQLPDINKTEHEHYRKYYTPVTRKIVQDAFILDIELFQYTF